MMIIFPKVVFIFVFAALFLSLQDDIIRRDEIYRSKLFHWVILPTKMSSVELIQLNGH